MFRKTINETPFTSQAANCCFSNISGNAWNHDVSFVSTLRALLADRIPAEEQVKLAIVSRNLGASQARSGASSILDHFAIPGPGDINIVNLVGATEDNEAWMSTIEKHFIEAFGQPWTRISRITEFFRKTFKVICFVNDASKNVYLFTEEMDTRRLHYLQCAVFAFLPWYFDPEKGVSELEMELIQSLRENSSDRYERCLEKMILKYDLREAEIRRLLSGFETRLEKSRMSSLTSQIDSIISDIASYNSAIRDCLKRKKDLDITLLGLKSKISESNEESEIMDYFIKNKNLSLESVTDSEITFVGKGYIEYFDEDMARNVICAEDYLYEYNNSNLSDEDMSRLLKAIFLDQTLKVKTCAAYRFKLGEYVIGLSSYGFGKDFDDCLPNPHINIYRCLGDYEPLINECIFKNEYLLAIEQSLASVRSLNFGDTTVMEAFMENLSASKRRGVKCIELPGGTMAYPEEAVEWLKSQEERNE